MPQSESIKVDAEEVSPSVRFLKVEVEATRVDKAFEKSFKELARSARVKGFRPGKVPAKVIEKMYGGAVAEEIEKQLVSETLLDAVQLAELTPLCEPDIEADSPQQGSPFRYTARIEVRPPIELPDLSTLTGKRMAVGVEDEEIDREIENLRRRNARLVEEDEGTKAAMGSVLTIDYAGSIDGVPFDGGTGKDMELELGSGRLIEGFEDQLVGAAAGADVEVRVTFPDDYGAERLKGKDAVFQVHVGAVKRREVPEADDEFAKDLGEFETLEDLRNRIRDDLMAQRLEASESLAKSSVMDSLIEKTEFEVPPGTVERELHAQISSMQRRYRGQVPDDMLRQQIARMHEEGRSGAERRVRESFLLAQVAKEHELEVSDEDVDARLAEMAEAQGIEEARIRQMAEDGGWTDALRADLLDQRALAFLVSEATVEEMATPEPTEDSP